MQDKTLVCKDCGEQFIFTVRDQEFFNQKGFTEPQRCPNCRQQRKQQQGNRSNGNNNGRPQRRY